jgi:hypothetical protein
MVCLKHVVANPNWALFLKTPGPTSPQGPTSAGWSWGCCSPTSPAPYMVSLLAKSPQGPTCPKIIKQRCYIREWGRGEGDFFFGLAIYRANNIYRDITVYSSRHPKQEAFWHYSRPTTIQLLWAGGSTITKLPMAIECLLQ